MNRTRILPVALLATAFLGGCERPSADISDVGAALAEAKGCIACHGTNGKGTGPTFPNLNGQWPSYLRTQLLKYREGDRQNAIMNGQAAALTDQEIDLLSSYYASK